MKPWRTGMDGRPEMPERMFVGGRPRKRWRWLGVFTDEVMLCAAEAHVGPARVEWWAIWDREARTLAEDTSRTRRRVQTSGTAVTVHSPPHQMQLRMTPGTAVETISPHGGNPIWTRKTPATVDGFVLLGDRRFELQEAPGFLDESAGYHARHTDWRWSAGVGTTTKGQTVTWNLVTGLHDDPDASERTVWIDDVPHHLPPLSFASDLSSIGDLQFKEEARRIHKDNLLLVATDYEQPFGSFTGSLPEAGPVTGYGVMERHSVRW